MTEYRLADRVLYLQRPQSPQVVVLFDSAAKVPRVCLQLQRRLQRGDMERGSSKEIKYDESWDLVRRAGNRCWLGVRAGFMSGRRRRSSRLGSWSNDALASFRKSLPLPDLSRRHHSAYSFRNWPKQDVFSNASNLKIVKVENRVDTRNSIASWKWDRARSS